MHILCASLVQIYDQNKIKSVESSNANQLKYWHLILQLLTSNQCLRASHFSIQTKTEVCASFVEPSQSKMKQEHFYSSFIRDMFTTVNFNLVITVQHHFYSRRTSCRLIEISILKCYKGRIKRSQNKIEYWVRIPFDLVLVCHMFNHVPFHNKCTFKMEWQNAEHVVSPFKVWNDKHFPSKDLLGNRKYQGHRPFMPVQFFEKQNPATGKSRTHRRRRKKGRTNVWSIHLRNISHWTYSTLYFLLLLAPKSIRRAVLTCPEAFSIWNIALTASVKWQIGVKTIYIGSYWNNYRDLLVFFECCSNKNC